MSDGGLGTDFGSARLVLLIEDRFGRGWANLFLVIVALGVVSAAVWAIAHLIVLPTASYLSELAGSPNSGISLLTISLDNIDIWITALFYLSVMLIAALIVVLLRTRRRISSRILIQLARLLDEGNNQILNRQVSNSQEYTQWKSDMDKWVGVVLNLLKSRVSEYEYLLFKNLVSVIPVQFDHAFDKSHNRELVHLDWQLGRLRSIIDRYSS